MNTLLDAMGAQVLTPVWTNASQFGPLTSPLVAAGDKLICVAEQIVYAVDIHTGKHVTLADATASSWAVELEEGSGNQPHATATNGVVYLMDGMYLRAVRLSDGTPLPGWESPPKLGRAISLIARHGLLMAVYLARSGSGAMVKAFHATTGALAYAEKAISRASPGPTAYGADAVFFVASGKLHGVNIRSGDTRWSLAAQEKFSEVNAPCVAGKLVLTSGRNLYGIAIDDGTEQFKIEPGKSGAASWYTPVYHIPNAVRAASKVVNLRASGPRLLAAEPEPVNLAAGVAVASNSQGELVCLSLADGRVVWRKQLETPVAAPTIIDGVVYIKTRNGAQLERFNLEQGASAGLPYSLGRLPNKQPATITNGMLFLPDELGNITASPYGKQLAAYFDGKSARIDIEAEGNQFDFGERNFTAEAWFRSSSGGEILSAYPSRPDADAGGFRINLTPSGQIRVALFSADGKRRRVGRTNASTACDGHWHHMALVRRNDCFMIVLDGVAQEVRLPEADDHQRLSIGGDTALTIGAFIAKRGAQPENHFAGLIREVRLWNCAMEAPLIESNRQVALLGNEPQLLGLWRLDESTPSADKATVAPRNDAGRHRMRANFIAPAFLPTDLHMDRSAFPYLLRESAKQWPYANTWGARGGAEVAGAPAVSHDGVVAFSTGSILYAVDAHDGRRKWNMDVSSHFSDPVADGDSFLVLTQDDSVVRIQARTGAKRQVAAFSGMQAGFDAVLPSPATSVDYLAAAVGNGGAKVLIAKREAEQALEVALPGTPVKLAFCHAGLLVLTRGGDDLLELHLIDCDTGAQLGQRRVGAPAFCAGGTWAYVVDGASVLKLDVARLDGAALARQDAIGAAVTGLAVAFDQGALVVSATDGTVTGLDAANMGILWASTVPFGAGKRVNEPVFDLAGRTICTSDSGAVAALATRTGQLIGYYQLQNGAIGTPAVRAGTVYTGCRDAQDELDGAMHSLVLGDTVALRLNLDARGAPVMDGKQHAVIKTNTEHTTLQLLRPGQSCVEAWINVPRLSGAGATRAGGGILGIAPAAESGFGIDLWLDGDGVVHYASHTLTDGAWGGVHLQAKTEIMDGRWHHLAVSKSDAAGHERVLLYIDGKPVPVQAGAGIVTPKAAGSNLTAYVGATVGADGTAARHFCGMIAEVRVWDTYLVAPAIQQRMQTKLRGDEPDLLAYWNFDYQAVHDSAQQGHSGVLALESTSAAPAWWLTDLPFAQPNYPYVSTTAIVETSPEGATYTLTARVCAADGASLADQRVELWYIKRRENDPDFITINGTAVQAVKQGTEPDPLLRAANLARVFRATTALDGTVALVINTSEPGHGPTLDLWTSFMPVNERFHINVLIDNQKLAKPAPPVLTAQAKLMQDYNYTRGDKINHERDRSTWRVVLRSREASGGIRTSEPVTLWAESATTIEAGGVRHQINSERSVTLDSELNGELTVVMEADDLVSPTLYARAGFMHRNDRIVINPDQDAQKQLLNMQAEDMTKQRQTNWQKDPVANAKGDSLLDKDQQPHAEDISKAVRQVASAVSSEEPKALFRGAPSPARRKLAELRRAQRPDGGALLRAGADDAHDDLSIDAMRQEAAGARTDGVVLLRTVAGVPRVALANPDAFRANLYGALGFVLEKNGAGKSVSYRPLYTKAEVTLAHFNPAPPPSRPLLGNFWDDAWDTIKDVATDVYEGATSIAVTIADSIQIAITKVVDGVTSMVNAVVSTVQDALKAIGGFFEQLVIAIKKVIAFLRALFDWGAILKAQGFFVKLMSSALKTQSGTLKDREKLRKIVTSIGAQDGSKVPAGKDSLNGSANKAGGRDSAVAQGADGVQANSMFQKSRENPMTAKDGGSVADAVLADGTLEKFSGIEHILPGLANSILDLSPADMVTQLLAAVNKAMANMAEKLADGFADACGALAEVVDFIASLMQTRIYIPFISEIYEWVTGTELTLLSLFALALGVFFNALYAFATFMLYGEARSFGDDSASVSRQIDKPLSAAPAPAGQVLLAEDNLPRTNGFAEVTYMGLRTLTIVLDLISDATYYAMATARRSTPSPKDKLALAGVGMFQALLGITGVLMFRLKCEPDYHARLNKGLGVNRDIAVRREWLIYTTMSLQGALAVVKLGKALATMYSGGVDTPATSWLTKITEKIGGYFSKRMYLMMQTLSVAAAGGIVYTLVDLYRPETANALDAIKYPHLKEQHTLLTYEAVMTMVPMLFEVLYTPDGIKQVLKTSPPSVVYGAAGVMRFLASGASVALHGVAVLDHGDVEWKSASAAT